MRLIDLSMPIWEGAGYGEILPMPNTPVRFVEYMAYDRHGVRMTRLKLDDETGSPFMTPVQGSPYRKDPLAPNPLYKWKLDEIPLDQLVLRDTVVLDVPGEDGHVITAEEIDTAVRNADYRDGDEILVRTGWGTTDKAFELRDDYCLKSPSWSYEACVRMAEIMERKDSKIIMTDCALIMTPAYQGYGWSVGEERMVPRPKPWPSAEARERMMDLPPGTFSPAPPSVGRGGYRDLVAKTMAICKCLVDANLLKQTRIQMIILPMLISKGGASPCRFIAVEDER
jgi:kynurenine formamidase